MPVRKCSNGKYKIGSGKCMYKSKASAERAYAAYLAKKHSKGHHSAEDGEFLDKRKRKFSSS